MNSTADVPVCLLNNLRETRGLSQAEVARRSGLTRQAVHVIESGTSVPSILTAYKLADALGCSVEELFPNPSMDTSFEVHLPHRARLVTPRLDIARVRDRWMGFPIDQPRSLGQGFRSADGVLERSKPNPMVKPLKPKCELERNFVVVGCDPGLGILRDHLATIARPGRMIWFNASSEESLKRLEQGQSHVAGIHFVGENDSENLRRANRLKLPEGGVLMRFAHWEMGWVVADGNPKNIRGVEDLVRKDIRFLNREKGSGSRYLLDVLLQKAGLTAKAIAGYESTASSHNDGGEKVSAGLADVAMGMRSVAMVHGLEFVPIAQVGFDLVIPSDYLEHPGIVQLCESLQGSRLRQELQSIPGYETSETGRILAKLAAQ